MARRKSSDGSPGLLLWMSSRSFFGRTCGVCNYRYLYLLCEMGNWVVNTKLHFQHWFLQLPTEVFRKTFLMERASRNKSVTCRKHGMYWASLVFTSVGFGWGVGLYHQATLHELLLSDVKLKKPRALVSRVLLDRSSGTPRLPSSPQSLTLSAACLYWPLHSLIYNALICCVRVP